MEVLTPHKLQREHLDSRESHESSRRVRSHCRWFSRDGHAERSKQGNDTARSVRTTNSGQVHDDTTSVPRMTSRLCKLAERGVEENSICHPNFSTPQHHTTRPNHKHDSTGCRHDIVTPLVTISPLGPGRTPTVHRCPKGIPAALQYT